MGFFRNPWAIPPQDWNQASPVIEVPVREPEGCDLCDIDIQCCSTPGISSQRSSCLAISMQNIKELEQYIWLTRNLDTYFGRLWVFAVAVYARPAVLEHKDKKNDSSDERYQKD